jgi:hypothetical protein
MATMGEGVTVAPTELEDMPEPKYLAKIDTAIHPIALRKLNIFIIISCFFRHRSWSPFFDSLCSFGQKRSIWGPLQNLVGAKMAPEIDQV